MVASAKAEHSTDMMPTGLPKILVVEDESIVAMDLGTQLNDMNYAVCGTANNGLDAIAQAWKTRPDLILMDIVLQGEMDGVEAASHISTALHIPILFLTAYSDNKTVSRATQAAPYGYLTKPFQARELRAAIEVALFKARLERRLRDSEQWFASMLRCVADGVVATDRNGIVRFMNAAAESMLGWQMSEAAGHTVEEIVPLRDMRSGTSLPNPVRLALENGTTVAVDFGTLLAGRNVDRLPIDDSAAPIRDETGNTLGAVIVFRDVHERIAAEEQLRQSEERFRNAFDFAPVGMALVGLDDRFLQVNSAVCALLDRADTELVGARQSDFSDHMDFSEEQSHLYDLLTGHASSVQFEKRYQTRSGGEIWTLVSVSLLRRNDEPLCYLFQIHDLTERKNVEYRLARLAHYDPLTGLANRAWLADEIERHIVQGRRYQKRFAVLFLDIDHFKQINDSLGHDAGDELLQIAAARLKASVRETDAVARLGGDEFVILLPEIHSEQEVVVVTDKIQIECARTVHIAGHEIGIAVSLGASIFPDDAQDGRTLLKYADSALYHAKAQGRNNLQFYRPELTARLEQRMKLGAGLRHAIERRELVLHYQPIVSLEDSRPLAAEALIRWNHPELGLLQPDAFIPIAEESGMSASIGEWVIREACREAADWTGKDQAPCLGINVSPRQFKTGNLVQIVERALADSAMAPSRLCIEITEQLLMEDTEQNLATIARLKSLGIGIAIDDFGTGYSSLSYIRRFEPAELKIDISLVRHAATNPADAAIVRAAIAMAHSLKILVVTEGVETAAQQAFLQSEHCDMAQGFFYAQPLCPADFRQWLRQRAPA